MRVLILFVAAQRRDLLQPSRGQGADRSLAAALQHRAPAQQPGLPTASAGNSFTAISGFRFATPLPGYGGGGHDPLTNQPAHSAGADQVSRSRNMRIVLASGVAAPRSKPRKRSQLKRPRISYSLRASLTLFCAARISNLNIATASYDGLPSR